MEYIDKDADISLCGKYRYTLTRVWDRSKPVCAFIGLNPSTADANDDDQTIRRCVRFANDWGYGELIMMNLFAFRATRPRELHLAADPVGTTLNDLYLYGQLYRIDLVVAAWGVHGSLFARDQEVRKLIEKEKQLYCLGKTKEGQPKHPLYIKANARPVLYQ